MNQSDQFQEAIKNTQIEEEKRNVILLPSETNIYFLGSAECDQFDLKDSKGEEQPECKRPFKIDFFYLQQITVIKIACGGLHTLFLTSLGKVYACGCNDVNALGKSENQSSDRIPSLVDLPVGIDMISAGDSHSVAANSQAPLVYFWGVYKNTSGNMSQPMVKPTRVGDTVFFKPIKKLLSGYNHTIVLMEQKVYCWGDQDTKVLGRKSITRQNISQALKPEALGVKNVIDVFTGGYHSFVKIEKTQKQSQDRQYCYYSFGLNNYGQLGIGNTDDALVPTEIEDFRGKNIIDIVGGEHHTIAMDHDGDVYAFGRNDEGQLGLGEEVNENLKEKAEANKVQKIEQLEAIQTAKGKQQLKIQQDLDTLKQSQKVFGYEYIIRPQRVKDIEKVQLISAAGHYTFAYSIKDQLFYSWGMGTHYVLGTREEDSIYTPNKISKEFFRNEQVLQISLGGQHVTVLTTTQKDYNLPSLNPELLKVPEELNLLPKLKSYRKAIPRSQSKQNGSTQDRASSNKDSKRSTKSKKPTNDDLEEPVRKLKLE